MGHRQSATLLSRTKDLDKAYVEKIRSKLQAAGVDPFDLSIIKQSKCPEVSAEDSKVNVDINPNTFSSQNIGGWVRKAGEKIGDGVEWAVGKGKQIVSRVSSYSGEESAENRSGKMWMP